MPSSKQAVSRYRTIDACLSSRLKKFWTLDEIREKLAERDLRVSQRTLEADLEAMRYDDRLGFHAPIVYNRARRAYCYEKDGYVMENFHLTKDEIDILSNSLDMLQDQGYPEALRQHREVILKILHRIKCI